MPASKARIQTDGLSYQPRGMDRIEAARYIGVGVILVDEIFARAESARGKG